MELTQLLEQDHRDIEALIEEIKDTSSRAKREREKLFSQLAALVMGHAKAEEKALYDEIVEEKEFHKDVLEGFEEHHVVEMLLKEMKKLPVSAEEWEAKLEVVGELLEHHVEEEEGDLFPRVRKACDSEELEHLGVIFEKKKAAIMGAALKSGSGRAGRMPANRRRASGREMAASA